MMKKNSPPKNKNKAAGDQQSWVTKAQKAKRKNKLPEALRHYHQANKIQPQVKIEKEIIALEQGLGHKKFAPLLADINHGRNIPACLDQCNQLLNQSPNLFVEQQKMICWVLQKKYAEAIKVAAGRLYLDSRLKYYLAYAHAMLGDYLKAFTFWQNFLDRADNGPQADAYCRAIWPEIESHFCEVEAKSLTQTGFRWILQQFTPAQEALFFENYLHHLLDQQQWEMSQTLITNFGRQQPMLTNPNLLWMQTQSLWNMVPTKNTSVYPLILSLLSCMYSYPLLTALQCTTTEQISRFRAHCQQLISYLLNTCEKSTALQIHIYINFLQQIDRQIQTQLLDEKITLTLPLVARQHNYLEFLYEKLMQWQATLDAPQRSSYLELVKFYAPGQENNDLGQVPMANLESRSIFTLQPTSQIMPKWMTINPFALLNVTPLSTKKEILTTVSQQLKTQDPHVLMQAQKILFDPAQKIFSAFLWTPPSPAAILPPKSTPPAKIDLPALELFK